ncbi:hypothetical protein WICPIJ_001115 [Wickerhamomyces pijperi]|uniref:Uncharacterized protein n=1 Tax=Wickerhamomyces pijperi TaxID=599730 RepID=A0A9P8QC98_WICPI|nr:hypothetical protein WICPIJ_001115 [Wickerhamomyces pijperi]
MFTFERLVILAFKEDISYRETSSSSSCPALGVSLCTAAFFLRICFLKPSLIDDLTLDMTSMKLRKLVDFRMYECEIEDEELLVTSASLLCICLRFLDPSGLYLDSLAKLSLEICLPRTVFLSYLTSKVLTACSHSQTTIEQQRLEKANTCDDPTDDEAKRHNTTNEGIFGEDSVFQNGNITINGLFNHRGVDRGVGDVCDVERRIGDVVVCDNTREKLIDAEIAQLLEGLIHYIQV